MSDKYRSLAGLHTVHLTGKFSSKQDLTRHGLVVLWSNHKKTLSTVSTSTVIDN